MMKKLFSLCVALAFTLILAACSGGGAPAGAYDPDATAQALLDSGAFSEALEALDADLISSLYGLESQPEAAAVYTSTGATAEEIAVLVFSTQEEADDARKALEARVSDQKDACEGYLPAELPKLEQAIVKESGSSATISAAEIAARPCSGTSTPSGPSGKAGRAATPPAVCGCGSAMANCSKRSRCL